MQALSKMSTIRTWGSGLRSPCTTWCGRRVPRPFGQIVSSRRFDPGRIFEALACGINLRGTKTPVALAEQKNITMRLLS